MRRCGGCGTRGMALDRARDGGHKYGHWWHAAYCVLHTIGKLPIAQTRQAELSAAPLTGTSTFPKAHSLRYD